MFAIGARLRRWILPVIAASAVTTGAAQSAINTHSTGTDWFGDGSLVVQLDPQGNPTGDTLEVVYHQLLPNNTTQPSTSQLKTGGVFNFKVLPSNTHVTHPGRYLLLQNTTVTPEVFEYAVDTPPKPSDKKIKSTRI